MNIHSIYNPPPAVFTDGGGDQVTKQEFAKEADVNTIMSRYQRTGSLPLTPERQARYGDFTNIDFRDIQDRVAAGRQEFELLPSDVRRRFDNDPAAYYEHVANADENELRDLGLLPPSPAPASAAEAPSAPVPAPSSAPAA